KLCPTPASVGRGRRRSRPRGLTPSDGAELRRQAGEGRELPQPPPLLPVELKQFMGPLAELSLLVRAEIKTSVDRPAFVPRRVAEGPSAPAPRALGAHGPRAPQARGVRLDFRSDRPPAGLDASGVIRRFHSPLLRRLVRSDHRPGRLPASVLGSG